MMIGLVLNILNSDFDGSVDIYVSDSDDDGIEQLEQLI